MKEFYTFKVKTHEAGMAMDAAMDVTPYVDFEIDANYDVWNKLKDATVKAWLTPTQVNVVINELHNHKGITVLQNANQRNTIFVSFL